MECPHCREQMHDEATVCPHCRQEHPKVKQKRHQRRWNVIVVGVAVVMGAFVFMIIVGTMIGNDPHAFDGDNGQAYEAARVYGTPLVDADIDKLVFDIAHHADLSHSDAEAAVVSCIKLHMTDTSLCENFANAAKGYAKLRSDGVIN